MARLFGNASQVGIRWWQLEKGVRVDRREDFQVMETVLRKNEGQILARGGTLEILAGKKRGAGENFGGAAQTS